MIIDWLGLEDLSSIRRRFIMMDFYFRFGDPIVGDRPFPDRSLFESWRMVMKLNIRENRDFWTGAMFIAIGATSVVLAHNYPFGSIRHMGPGFFPSILGGLLIPMGIYTMVKGIQSKEKFEGTWPVRALIIIPGVILLTGFVMKIWGFIPALVFLTIGSSSAGKEFNFFEALLLSIVLTIISVLTFIWGLGLPFPLIAF